MSCCPQENCELLPWDSQCFHCRIARLVGDTIGVEQEVEIDKWSHKNHVECLYFLARADHASTRAAALKNGFELVDIRMTFAITFGSPMPRAGFEAPSTAAIGPVQPMDLPALQILARMLHADTRFFSDYSFPRTLAESLYFSWITLECKGRAQQVFVATSSANEPVRYMYL